MIFSSLDGTPLPHEQQSYYGCSSPTSNLDHFLVDYLPQSLTDCSKWAWLQKFMRIICTWNPPYQNPRSATAFSCVPVSVLDIKQILNHHAWSRHATQKADFHPEILVWGGRGVAAMLSPLPRAVSLGISGFQ